MKVGQREFLTTRDAAHRLGVAVPTVQSWVESGVLPAWKTAGGHRRIPREAVDQLVARQQAAREAAHPAAGFKVLVVEDDPVHLELYRVNLAGWGLPVELLTAEDGFEGLELVGRHDPDLVVADLAMPGMDGFQMVRHLADTARHGRPALIVVTALTPAQIAAGGSLPPGIPVYPKPIPFAALRTLVEHRARLQRGDRDVPRKA